MNPLIHVPQASSGKARSAGASGSGGPRRDRVARVSVRGAVAGSVVSAVVRVRAKFGGSWAMPGTGFCIRQWDTCVVTARHLVMTPDGAGPTDLEIRAGTGPAAARLHCSAIAFFPPDRDIDVAVVRVHESLVSPLEAASVPDEANAQIWGYREGRMVLDKFDTRASLKRPCLELTKSGLPGMSGGPVLFVPDDGTKPQQVMGIYLGLRQQPGGQLTPTAYVVDDEDVKRCWQQLQGIA